MVNHLVMVVMLFDGDGRTYAPTVNHLVMGVMVVMVILIVMVNHW